ncbi:MAG: cytochrome c3 family protein [Deltaproteobacteria bacterium]|nr:cytochrome c3 family protein [Deltaproteobacteria bacterium]
MFSKRFDQRVYLALATVVGSVVLGLALGVFSLWPSRVESGYTPSQPIPFSHELHAGTLAIDCQYCHSNASKGAHATVPALSTCMNCHSKVQTKTPAGDLKPGLATLLQHWERGEPVLWTKVNDVADFVYFEHSRHVNSGLRCQECHGPVEQMTHLRREHALKMAFCIDCHSQAPEAEAPAAAPTADTVPQPASGTRAPTTCTTCHR